MHVPRARLSVGDVVTHEYRDGHRDRQRGGIGLRGFEQPNGERLRQYRERDVSVK